MGGAGTGHQQCLLLCVMGLLLPVSGCVCVYVVLSNVDLCACAGLFVQSCLLVFQAVSPSFAWWLSGGLGQWRRSL